MCFALKEHDIYLPMIVLEELDAHKKGMTEVSATPAKSAARSTRWLLPAARTWRAV